MARKVFFSFEYNDVSRAMVVRNSWVTQGKEAAGFIDVADFEEIENELMQLLLKARRTKVGDIGYTREVFKRELKTRVDIIQRYLVG